jgi:hypothetical protein
MLIETILACEEAEVTAICDVYEDRLERSAELINKMRGTTPDKYTDYKDVLKSDNVDAVLVATAWETHISIAIEAMKAGKITALEVGGACSIEECWKLVHTYEETGTPIMMMENCCYDRFELISTALVRSGKLGEIVHCHGAYGHDLRDEISGGNVRRHYRLPNYIARNCENYPTHELGPIAKILNINRGNRMTSLVSVASKAEGLREFLTSDKNPDKSLIGTEFKQGDIVSTIITCAGGETITLTLDTTLPKYYSREFTVRGTRGLANQEADMIVIEGETENTHEYWENCKSSGKYDAYLTDIWKNITPEQMEVGHGGIDYIEFKEFFKAIREGREMPIDIYDAASWMCITALSEQSIAMGGMPQSIPDFTKGKWLLREPEDVIEFPNPDKK